MFGRLCLRCAVSLGFTSEELEERDLKMRRFLRTVITHSTTLTLESSMSMKVLCPSSLHLNPASIKIIIEGEDVMEGIVTQ
ncbi:hypothetical protein PO909_024913 [Leuciscus waleckii]